MRASGERRYLLSQPSLVYRLGAFGAMLGLAISCRSSENSKSGSSVAGAAPDEGAALLAKIDLPAARQFAAWLTAFNAGDRAGLLAYHEKSFPYDVGNRDVANIDRELGLTERTGGFLVKQAEQSTATQFIVLLRERYSEQFARVSMDVDAAEPHRITRFEIGPTPTPSEFRAVHLSEGDAIAALRAQIAEAVAADRFSGAVLVARNGSSIFAQAYGWADREHKVPNELETRFRIGSMNKMFTAVAVMQLVEAGKLRLGDTLEKVLPDYPNKQLASQVTLHHLLTHTGGTGDIFGPEFDAHRGELRTIQDYVTVYGARDLRFEPSTKWEYSNYGFILLGAVIEKLTGQSYYDWVSEHVFKPAGMTATSSPPEDQVQPGRSVAYTRQSRNLPWVPAAERLPYRGTSAGGGDSTVGDLLRFANAIVNHELVDAQHTALLTTGKVATPNGGQYCYGFGERRVDRVRCFGHNGGAPGMNGRLSICSSGYTVAVLSNLDPPAADRLADFVIPRLPEK